MNVMIKAKFAKGWGYGSGDKALGAQEEAWSLSHQSPWKSQVDMIAT